MSKFPDWKTATISRFSILDGVLIFPIFDIDSILLPSGLTLNIKAGFEDFGGYFF